MRLDEQSPIPQGIPQNGTEPIAPQWCIPQIIPQNGAELTAPQWCIPQNGSPDHKHTAGWGTIPQGIPQDGAPYSTYFEQ